jgi:deoxyadenosine/deoxycytidine kinase
MLVEEEYISEEEHRMYLDFYDRLGFNVDMHIYLKVDPTIAYQRIMQRDRAAERTLQFGYLKALYNKYEEQFSQMENVYIVDANRSLDEVKASVVKILEDPSI